jgi:hypothetical protein
MTLGILLLLCPVIAMFGSYLVASGWTAKGWVLIAVSLLASLKWVPALLRPNPQVVIDEAGIWDRRFGTDVIPWAQIVLIEPHWVLSHAALILHLSDERAVLRTVPPLRRLALQVNRVLGRRPFTIDFANLTPGIDDAIAFIENAEFAHHHLAQ